MLVTIAPAVSETAQIFSAIRKTIPLDDFAHVPMNRFMANKNETDGATADRRGWLETHRGVAAAPDQALIRAPLDSRWKM
jgi:hypothetical protein